MKSFLLLSPLLLTLLQNERNEWYNYQGKKKRKKEIYFKNLFKKKTFTVIFARFVVRSILTN